MANYNSLKATIDANVKQNGVQAITGQILNAVLNQMVNTLGAGYQFAGVATTATNPGSPDAKVFYIANGKGTYTNFGGINVTEDDVVVLYWDSSWHKVQTGVASQALLGDVANEVTTMREMVDSHDALLSGETAPVQFTESTGNYITPSGSVGPLASGRISDPIHLSTGETIIVTGGANSGVAMISKTNDAGSLYIPVAIGTGSTQTITLQTAEYRALEDGYVALSSIGSSYTMSAHIKTPGGIESEIYSLQAGQELNETNIQSLRNEVGVAIGTPVSYTTTSGNYVSPSGSVSPLASGRISSPIPVSNGEILSFTGKANSGVAMISKTNDAGSLYIPVAIGTGSTQTITLQTAEYRALEDGYVALSMLDSTGEGSAEIITYDGILGKLSDVKIEVGSLIPRVESLESNSASTINILSAFDNIVCVGDSLTYSQVYTGISANRQARRTYPQVLAGLCGNTQTTLARAGATALSCWNEFGSQVVSKTNPLAIIYLGTNYGVTDTLETDVVGNDPTSWAENNVGCYCRFVQKFLSLGYKVLLLRIWATSGTGTSDLGHTNLAITHIAERFGCAVMDVPVTRALEYHYYPDLSGQNGVHYNDLGYSWFASKLIEKTGLLPIEQMKLIIPNA